MSDPIGRGNAFYLISLSLGPVKEHRFTKLSLREDTLNSG